MASALILCSMAARASDASLSTFDAEYRKIVEISQPEQGKAFLETALKRAETVGDREGAAAAALELDLHAYPQATLDDALKYQTLAKGYVDRTANGTVALRYRLAEIRILKGQNQLDKAKAQGDQLIGDCRSRGDKACELEVLIALAYRSWATTAPTSAFSHFSRDAFELAQSYPGNRPAWLARTLWGNRLSVEGDHAAAMHLAEVNLKEQRESGDAIDQVKTMVWMAQLSGRQGQWAQGEQWAGAAMRTAAGLGGPSNSIANSLVNRSDDLLRAGRYAEALAVATQASTYGAPDSLMRHLGEFNRGIALNRLGQHAEGMAILEREAEVLGREGSLEELAHEHAVAGNFKTAYDYLARHQQAQAKDSSAVRDAEAALEEATETVHRERAMRDASEHRQRILAIAMLAGTALLGLIFATWKVRTTRRHASALAQANEQLQAMAVTDALTGLHNRHHFTSQVPKHVAAAQRSHAEPGRSPEEATDLLFFLIDMDHFKQVNDTYGHHAGDALLQQTSQRLRSVVRGEDELIRWGGEEFLLMTRGTPRAQAAQMAERLRTCMEEMPFQLPDGTPLARTASIGFAAFPLQAGQPQAGTWEEAVEIADQALYFAKRDGRNTWAGLVSATRLEGIGDSSYLEAQRMESGFLARNRSAPSFNEINVQTEVKPSCLVTPR